MPREGEQQQPYKCGILDFLGLGEVQLVKCLAHRQEDLSSDPQHLIKMLDKENYMCNPIPRGGWEHDPWDLMASYSD